MISPNHRREPADSRRGVPSRPLNGLNPIVPELALRYRANLLGGARAKASFLRPLLWNEPVPRRGCRSPFLHSPSARTLRRGGSGQGQCWNETTLACKREKVEPRKEKFVRLGPPPGTVPSGNEADGDRTPAFCTDRTRTGSPPARVRGTLFEVT